MPEPVAAVMSVMRTRKTDGIFLIYDFGGGTFDATVLQLTSEIGEAPQYKKLSTYGICNLGGDSIDWKLVEIIAKHIQEETDIDILTNPSSIEAKAIVKEKAEQAKIQFSVSEETEIEVELAPIELDRNNKEKRASNIIISRDSFLSAIQPILEKTIECVKMVLKSASAKA